MVELICSQTVPKELIHADVFAALDNGVAPDNKCSGAMYLQ